MTAHVGEDVAKEEHSCIAGGIANWYNYYGNYSGGSTENQKEFYLRASYTTPGNIPQRSSIIPQGYMFYYIHSSLICNRQRLETTQMSVNQRMNTKNVVHLNNGILFSY